MKTDNRKPSVNYNAPTLLVCDLSSREQIICDAQLTEKKKKALYSFAWWKRDSVDRCDACQKVSFKWTLSIYNFPFSILFRSHSNSRDRADKRIQWAAQCIICDQSLHVKRTFPPSFLFLLAGRFVLLFQRVSRFFHYELLTWWLFQQELSSFLYDNVPFIPPSPPCTFHFSPPNLLPLVMCLNFQ